MNHFKITLVFLLGSLMLVNQSICQTLKLKDIVVKAENRLRGESSIATATITVVRPKYTQEIKLKIWTQTDSLYLIYIDSPSKDKGSVYLKRDKEIWYYLPSINRNIKMQPSMMNQKWMGTDVNNGDLVRKSSLVNDYNHKMLAEDSANGKLCYHIELTPNENSEIIWGKVEIWVDKEFFNIMKYEKYDKKMLLVKTMNASNVREIGGEKVPTKMELIPADKSNQKTIMEYNSIQFNVNIPDSCFIPQYMTKINP